MNSGIHNRLVKLHGSKKPLPAGCVLRAGDLDLIYENGSIRYISAGGYEIIRSVYAAVRGEKWITVEPAITKERIIKGKNSFRISYHAVYQYNDIDFEADYRLTGSGDNTLTFEQDGRANSTFMKNRIGFCVLHPVHACKGQPCTVVHPDGNTTTGIFPVNISPHQPFKNISVMKWRIGSELDICLRFHGDVFETEDQRNWTDASFKTYSTPLELPYPVKILKGSRISQKVELKISGKIKRQRYLRKIPVFSISDNIPKPAPEIGLSISSRKRAMTKDEAAFLRHKGFSHLRAELHLFSKYFMNQYGKIAGESEKTELPVHLCLFFSHQIDEQFRDFLALYEDHPVNIHSFLLFSVDDKVTPPELVKTLLPLLKKEFGPVPVGAGTNCNFAQLNRVRAEYDSVDFLGYAIHPQEHAGDDITILENIRAQRDTVITADEFKRNKSIRISPVTLQRRFNANAGTCEMSGDRSNMPFQVDVRQMSLFGAAWTVGSLKYLLDSGVSGITYFETIGERGLFMGYDEPEWPEAFPGLKGMFYPVYPVFMFLLKKKHSRVIPAHSEIPDVIDGFAIASDNEGLIFLSNFTGNRQRISLKGLNGLRSVIRINTITYNRITSQPDHYNFKSNKAGISNPVIEMLPYETRILSAFVKN